MQRLRFRSNIDLALRLGSIGLALCTGATAGCGDDPDDLPDAAVCGPGDAPATGLAASGGGATLSFGELTAGINNDCPSTGTPNGVISMTILGKQIGAQGLITLCVSRPDLLSSQSQPLVKDVPGSAGVLFVDLAGSADGCTLELDQSQPMAGTVTAAGLCGNGSDEAGFALDVSGTVSLTRTCGQTVDTIDVALQGRVAVAAQ